MKKRICVLFFSFVLVLMLALTACSSANETDSNDTTSTGSAMEDGTDISEEDTSVETEDVVYEWDAGGLAYLGMSREKLLEIYNAYDAALEENGYDEDAGASQVADAYGLTAEDVTNIAVYGCAANYFSTFDVNNVTIDFADSVEVNTFGDTVNLKAYITPGASNKMTIDQNYYIACDFVRDYAGTDFETINYSSYALDTDGEYIKVVSFTLTGDIIDTIANSTSTTFADNTLADYLDDLYILPSLQS